MIFSPKATFPLAARLQNGEAVALGEIFSFLSGLYFRGKLAYAKRFARPPEGLPGALVITSNRGLIHVDRPVDLEELRSFSRVPIDETDERYRRPLLEDAFRLRAADCEVVLLGSIGTRKYVDVLLECFGERLHFPDTFVGRGDMSRGGLLLRCVRDDRELTYAHLAGATRRGRRPPKLPPCSWQN